MKLATWIAELLDLLLPAGCVACGDRIPPEAGSELVCGVCRARLPTAPWPRCPRCHSPAGTGRVPGPECPDCRDWPSGLTAARHAVVLGPPADALVHGLKYDGWRELSVEMGERMARLEVPTPGPEPPLVIPVPTTRARNRSRGYNQAELLARAFSRARAWPFADALTRRRGGRTQVALSPGDRRHNVAGAFAVRGALRSRLRGVYVVLVDDVLTTGSTAAAVVSVLTAAGAAGVTLVTYARSLPFRPR